MIFVTVGTQLPFDRLIQTLDQWAAQRDAQPEVFAQIGPEGRAPTTIEFVRTMNATEFAEKLNAATCVIAHAGMGTILSALEIGKKVIVMPRQASLGEHRNDHQLATAKKLGDAGMVDVAADEHELIKLLDNLDEPSESSTISAYASEPLLNAVRQFIFRNNAAEQPTINVVSETSAATEPTKATHA